MSGYIKRSAWLAAALLGGLGLVLSAEGASFDCGKASTKVERIICDTPEISKLDDELNAAYKAAVQDKQQAELTRQAQKFWIKVRNACGDAKCVKASYQNRLLALPRAPFDDAEGEIANNAHRQIPSASPYELLQEEPYEPLSEICGEFTAMLNEFGPKEPQMRCEQKLHPAFPKFKPIELQPLPEKDNFKYFTAIDDLGSKGSASQFNFEPPCHVVHALD